MEVIKKSLARSLIEWEGRRQHAERAELDTVNNAMRYCYDNQLILCQ